MGTFGQRGCIVIYGHGSSPALGNGRSGLSAPEDLSSYAWHKGSQDGEESKAVPHACGAVLQWVTTGLESDEGISA